MQSPPLDLLCSAVLIHLRLLYVCACACAEVTKAGQIVPQQTEIVKLPDLSGLNANQATDKFLDSEEFYVERGLRTASEVFEQVSPSARVCACALRSGRCAKLCPAVCLPCALTHSGSLRSA